jgi:hypothetical protein
MSNRHSAALRLLAAGKRLGAIDQGPYLLSLLSESFHVLIRFHVSTPIRNAFPYVDAPTGFI